MPGEAEADAVRDAFLRTAGADPSGVASTLSRADRATRARAAGRLQQERGNGFMQRVAAEARGTPGRLIGLSQPEMVDEVRRRKGPGSPLPEGTRRQMEGFFGADMQGVRVHTDSEAATLSRELNAAAFTVGHDVFFAEGRYDPGSTPGQGLLAHELAHVGQQGGFDGPASQRQAEEEEGEEVQRQAEEEEEVQAQEEEEEEGLQARPT